MPNPTLIRFIRLNIYMLKRRFGERVNVYRVLTSDTNVETGIKTVTRQRITVKKVPVLPSRMKREVTQTISMISADKAFVYGGYYDSSRREFMFDARDLPDGWEFQPEDYIAYRGQRWNITNIERFEYDTGWVIDAHCVPDAPINSVHEAEAEDTVSFTDEVEEA